MPVNKENNDTNNKSDKQRLMSPFTDNVPVSGQVKGNVFTDTVKQDPYD